MAKRPSGAARPVEQNLGQQLDVPRERDEVAAEEDHVGRESLHLLHDLAIEAAAHERRHVRVGEKGDAVAVERRGQVVDDDLVTRDLDVVNVVVRAEPPQPREWDVRFAQRNDVGRLLANADQRRGREGSSRERDRGSSNSPPPRR